MAKNKLLKWFVGLSSVALFTGFVGLSQQMDQANAAAGKENSNPDRTNASSSNIHDDIKQEWAQTDPQVTDNQPLMNQQQPSMQSDDQSNVTNQKHGGRMRSRASESSH